MSVNESMIDLVRAFNGVRLAAMHIDMQANYFFSGLRDRTDFVFSIVDEFSDQLRDSNVPNYWVAYTSEWNEYSYREFQDFHAYDEAIDQNIYVPDDDMVFTKKAQGAFLEESDCLITRHFNDIGIDVLIIDGLKDIHCIADTVKGALDNGFRVYVPLDATNWTGASIKEYAEWFFAEKELTLEQKQRVTFTSRSSIIEALQQVGKRDSMKFDQPPLLAHG